MQCPAFYGTRSLLQRSEEPAIFPVLSHVHPKISLICTIILSFQLRPSLPSVLLPSGLTTKTEYACPFFPICANCPMHIILLYLIALIIFGEVHKSRSFSKCSHVVVNPSAWSDGHCPHAARSHSFVYISTS